MNAALPVVSFTRAFDASHPDRGWTDQELNDLESGRFAFTVPGIVIEGQRWTLHPDNFYIDVINLLRSLTADAAQIQAAESRFQQGVYNWRLDR
jgi:hypothetical protein